MKVEYDKLFEEVKYLLHDCKSFTLGADICTQRGLVHSYIAFTAQFFSVSLLFWMSTLEFSWLQPHTGRLENVCLDVVEMKTAHVSQKICQLTDDVLAKFGVPESKVARYSIDNGSNFIKGYKLDYLTLLMSSDSDVAESDVDELMAMIGDANLDESYFGQVFFYLIHYINHLYPEQRHVKNVNFIF